MTPRVGDRVVIHTPDRREFRGRVTALTTLPGDRPAAVIRLDTGWETTYPLTLIRPEKSAG